MTLEYAMNRKNDFKEFLNLKQHPTKAKAVELCGEEFINELTAQKILAKDDLFWERVCEKLNVPEYQKQRHLRLQEEQREKERLLANLKLFEKRNRKEWELLIFELPDSNIFDKKYVAIAQKDDIKIENLDIFYWGKTPNDAFGKICSPIDSLEHRIKKAIELQERYLVLKSIYLMFLYLSGDDNYAEFCREDIENKEKFLGISSWINLDFDILNKLERDAFVSRRWTSNNATTLTKKGILSAINCLKNLDLEEPEKSLLNLKLQKKSYHEEYANYENKYDVNNVDEIDNID